MQIRLILIFSSSKECSSEQLRRKLQQNFLNIKTLLSLVEIASSYLNKRRLK
jgi:hypothetical protein